MVGMLSAIPKTPCTRGWPQKAASTRIASRIRHKCYSGPHVAARNWRDGYVQLMQELYEPTAYFDRLDDLFVRGNFRFSQTRAAYWRRHPWSGLKERDASRSLRAHLLAAHAGSAEVELRREISSANRWLSSTRRDPVALFVYLRVCHPLSLYTPWSKHGCSAAPHCEFV